MKKIIHSSVAILLAATMFSGSARAEKDIVDTAAGVETFSTLVAAVKAAGLVDTLKGDGPFTVFAPTNDAFAKLPAGTVESLLKPENKDKLVAILTYHVVPGKVLAKDVVKLDSAKTVQGQDVSIKVEGGTVMINGANVVTTDIMTSNGVIHVIDSVLLPPAEKNSQSPRRMIEQVVHQGSDLYNGGHVAACSKLYNEALTKLAAEHGKKMSPRIQRHIHHTLERAEHVHDHDARAWMFRRALDVTYSSMEPLP